MTATPDAVRRPAVPSPRRPGIRLTDDERHAFSWRVIRDAYLEADRKHWERRARELEAARPRPGDFTGHATAEQLRATWDRLTDAAAACRARATLTEHAAAAHDDAMADLATGEAREAAHLRGATR